jgi:RNA polymerase sigma factor (sigma-70 family)
MSKLMSPPPGSPAAAQVRQRNQLDCCQTPCRPTKESQLRVPASENRDRLILEHLPQVRLIARRIHGHLLESVNLDDLISTGTLGLIAAIDHFDPNHNVKLKTYAEYKIRGAILDSLRGLDWAPRHQRQRSKQVAAAIAAAQQRLHHSPTEDEIAQELKLSLEEYHEWLVAIQGVNLGESRDLGSRRQRPQSTAIHLRRRGELAFACARTIGAATSAGRSDRKNATNRADRHQPSLPRGTDVARDRQGGESARVPNLATEVAGNFTFTLLFENSLAAGTRRSARIRQRLGAVRTRKGVGSAGGWRRVSRIIRTPSSFIVRPTCAFGNYSKVDADESTYR